MRDYTKAATGGGRGDDGLLQRFQLMVWPDTVKGWKNVDRNPDAKARMEAYGAIERLVALDVAGVGVTSDTPEGIPFLRFTPSAQKIFNDWRAGFERHIQEEEIPAVEAHLAKYRSLIPSLALIMHLVDCGVGAVGEDSLKNAIGLGEYLESHARRIYSNALDPFRHAKALRKRILDGSLTDGFTSRDVYRHKWSNLQSKDVVSVAINDLIDMNWLKEEQSHTKGRLRVCYRVNPKIRKQPDKELTKVTEVCPCA